MNNWPIVLLAVFFGLLSLRELVRFGALDEEAQRHLVAEPGGLWIMGPGRYLDESRYTDVGNAIRVRGLVSLGMAVVWTLLTLLCVALLVAA